MWNLPGALAADPYGGSSTALADFGSGLLPPSLPSLPPPPSFQSLPLPAASLVAASDLAAALGDRVRLSQAGEALAGISAACRERAERAQGFVADAWAAKRASAAAAFVR